MKAIQNLALSVGLIVLLSAQAALATGEALNEEGTFTSHHEVFQESYREKVKELPNKRKLGVHEYLNYEQREPCQFYQPIPEGFMRDGCHVVKIPQKQPERRPVLADYKINFDFDSDAIEPPAEEVIDKLAREINTFKPGEVTVAGHTDTAGPPDYNVELSQRRAEAVSRALSARGVEHTVLEKKAYGETVPAVETGDGTALRENRRVVVEFLK